MGFGLNRQETGIEGRLEEGSTETRKSCRVRPREREREGGEGGVGERERERRERGGGEIR